AELGVLPAAPPSLFGLEAGDAAWVERRQTAHPGGVYDQVLHYDAEYWARLPRRFIDCTEPALATIAASRQRVRSEPGWVVDEIATGHDAMISAPEALLACLLATAQDRTKS
ncbi:MAG TPA: alpha/beta hydrolase, partial [Burkholderiaceae bacterium]|nr:alpha/beta hydrolase [Burkholderiaceae bacterium]